MSLNPSGFGFVVAARPTVAKASQQMAAAVITKRRFSIVGPLMHRENGPPRRGSCAGSIRINTVVEIKVVARGAPAGLLHRFFWSGSGLDQCRLWSSPSWWPFYDGRKHDGRNLLDLTRVLHLN